MNSVTDRKHGAAPNEEWVLMYRGGLTRGQIVKLVGAPVSTVGYHLAAARSTDPVHRSGSASRP